MLKEFSAFFVAHWHAVITVILLLVISVLHLSVKHVVGRLDIAQKRTAIVLFRNLLIIGFFIFLVGIWRTELKSLALSIAAIGAALLLVTKEGVLNVVGGLFKLMFRSQYRIGSKIEINGLRGEIIDHNISYTTLLEIGEAGHYTGTILDIPNTFFLTSPIHNYSYLAPYAFHTVPVVISREKAAFVLEYEADLLKLATQHCSPFKDEITEHFNQFSGSQHLELPDITPRVTIQVDATGFKLNLRFACPERKRLTLEQKILREFLAKNQQSLGITKLVQETN